MSTRNPIRAGAFLTWILASTVSPAAQSLSAQGADVPLARPRAVDPALEFLAPYGLSNFSPQHIEALQTFLGAQTAMRSGRGAAAKNRLDRFWSDYPVGDGSWQTLPTQPFGLNLGSPPAYYGLRMLSTWADWKVANPAAPPPARRVRLTVVLVGHSNGIEPRTFQELASGGGVPATHDLDARLLADDHALIHESLRLFREYVVALTQGQLGVETRILSLPDVDLPVHAYRQGSANFAALVDFTDVWPYVSTTEQLESDWWWLIYPSHVPEQYAPFQTTEFITGGMGVGPESTAPLFVIDDRWLVRKPPHLGQGEYSKVERQAYLPQWLQHEFFHYLFRRYPQFGLEASPHQWFDPATWPADFVGTYEPDYYHEAWSRRLLSATPPLHVGLRHATAGAPWHAITVADLLDTFTREPVLNPWHIGDIRYDGSQLEWLNTAGVSWNLTPDLANGRLTTGPDCPYFSLWNGKAFRVELERDALGDLTTEVEGFTFLGELYGK